MDCIGAEMEWIRVGKEQFSLRDEQFPSRDEQFWDEDEPFLVRDEPFLVRDEQFPSRDEQFSVRDEPFSSRNEQFWDGKYSSRRRIGSEFRPIRGIESGGKREDSGETAGAGDLSDRRLENFLWHAGISRR